MINVTRLCCGGKFEGDRLRYSRRVDTKPVVVWNCTLKCNLRCRHCYSGAGDSPAPDGLSTADAGRMLADLAGYGVPVVLFSGGEPLMRPDIFELGNAASDIGMRAVLSTNGTLIDCGVAGRLKASGFSYIGVSLDGFGGVNDEFRGSAGAFERARRGISACMEMGLKVGLRMTVTRHNRSELKKLLDFALREGISRFCVYHLVYCGRGSDMLVDDLDMEENRLLMSEIIRLSERSFCINGEFEILTVDNQADGPYIYLKLLDEDPARAGAALKLLNLSGGNRSGVGIACIDADGRVFPDQFMREHPVGSVREKEFSRIWGDPASCLLENLRDRKPLLKGRCARCRWVDICNGGMRARAYSVYRDLWAEDPACYLTDEEIISR